MTLGDTINACYEAFGAVAVGLNCRATYKAKRIEGVSFLTMLFFTSWGLYNCWFYQSIEQYFSWYASFAVFSVNVVWCGLFVYYTWINPKSGQSADSFGKSGLRRVCGSAVPLNYPQPPGLRMKDKELSPK